MILHLIQNEKECLHNLVEHFNNTVTQLMNDFHTESHKMRYLCNAVLGNKWTTFPLNNISIAQYSFLQLILVLSESIQLERVVEKASTSSKKIMTNSPNILKVYTNTTLFIGVTKNQRDY